MKTKFTVAITALTFVGATLAYAAQAVRPLTASPTTVEQTAAVPGRDTIPALELVPAKTVTATGSGEEVKTATQRPAKPRYGLIRYDSLLHAMPEYAIMQIQLKKLRQQYAAEATYNETDFRRQFTEFLQGQKDFPENILLKRQRDLQEAMEKGLAFRHDADSLLRRAAIDMEAPVRRQLDEAIRQVGHERGYDCIINIDSGTTPYVNPALAENASPHVAAWLNARRNGR